MLRQKQETIMMLAAVSSCEEAIPGRSARSRYAEPGALQQNRLFDAIARAGEDYGRAQCPRC